MPMACNLLLVLAALAAAAPAVGRRPQEPEPPPAAPAPERADSELRAAWKRLAPEKRREVLEWVRFELEFEGSFQQGLLRHALGSASRPPTDWPPAAPPPVYDPTVHAPAQPIARKPLPADGARARELRVRVFARVPARKLDSAWSYDYGSGELRRGERAGELDRRFENLLAGFPEDLDLAEALVELRLDDGAQRVALAAFGHAYADRGGAVFPGVTLYDAWCSGIQMEMPDVECLGLVHDILGDWKTWRAPVPAGRQRELYGRIEGLFQAAHRHRGLRHALARAYFVADPVLRDGYGPHVERFHALWDLFASDPARLAGELPAAADGPAWLEALVERLRAEPELLERGRVRRATLAADQRRVRATLAQVMEISGALAD